MIEDAVDDVVDDVDASREDVRETIENLVKYGVSIKDAKESARHKYTDVYKACADRGPDQFHCERRKGHEGPHMALDGEITWSQYFQEGEV